MGLEDRDYVRGEHPSQCNCSKCVQIRAEMARSERKRNYLRRFNMVHEEEQRKLVKGIRTERRFLDKNVLIIRDLSLIIGVVVTVILLIIRVRN
jgi:hypothetical protein